MDKIFTVTLLPPEYLQPRRPMPAENHVRNIGYGFDMETALAILNDPPFEPIIYPYAIIECFKPGAFPATLSRQLLHYNNADKQYIAIPEPEGFKRIVNFGIG